MMMTASTIDLAFSPDEPRGGHGQWIHVGGPEDMVPAGKVRKGSFVRIRDKSYQVTANRKHFRGVPGMRTIDLQAPEDVGVRHRMIHRSAERDLMSVLRPPGGKPHPHSAPEEIGSVMHPLSMWGGTPWEDSGERSMGKLTPAGQITPGMTVHTAGRTWRVDTAGPAPGNPVMRQLRLVNTAKPSESMHIAGHPVRGAMRVTSSPAAGPAHPLAGARAAHASARGIPTAVLRARQPARGRPKA